VLPLHFELKTNQLTDLWQIIENQKHPDPVPRNSSNCSQWMFKAAWIVAGFVRDLRL
jgi:hypothetical protein